METTKKPSTNIIVNEPLSNVEPLSPDSEFQLQPKKFMKTELIDIEAVKFLMSLPDKELFRYFKKKVKANHIKYDESGTRKLLYNILEADKLEVNRNYTISRCWRSYVDGKGIQGLQSDIRNFILNKNYKDYDISCADPSILLFITKKAGLPTKYLQQFCEKREKLYDRGDGDREKAKEEIHSLFNMDQPYETGHSFVDKLFSEVVENKKKIIDEYKDLIHPSREKNEKGNELSSQVGNIIWCVENFILNKAMERFGNKYDLPLYDGFPSTNDINIIDLNALT